MHILFVDDTFETRDLFRLCFTVDGHIADTAHNGPEALRIIKQSASRFDAMIIDYHMPQMNGLDVVRELKQLEETAAIPIILFTGDGTSVLEGEAEALGVDRVVHKPIVPSELIALAQEVIDSA